VIHAVGPIWGEGDEDRKLAVAITGSLACAEELGLKTIAFPAISTGIFGFPLERAAQIFFAAFEQYFNDHPASQIERVRLVLYNDSDVPVFTRAADQRFHP
jgi:O-acetyl-ADP-ribose deacetylase (regulator of RNase III)